ncbi:hypothetical protein [Dictyobacter formicarum]|uniref:Uncharacterized protein n=1 Tax=Dictyobacter formicarum TaxID=2778368 RepID=A0ABQ3VQF8_9CHLR|nr:hypothetical protein [Dictyobacter formicarum]GHO88050.1 hypothetical protein KSZ_60560 [Dictyobacter formicarum]
MNNESLPPDGDSREIQWLHLPIRIPANVVEDVKKAYRELQHIRYGASMDEPLPDDKAAGGLIYWICIEAIGDYINLPELERRFKSKAEPS